MKAIVITVSDSCFAGKREDRSGPEVAERLQRAGFEVESLVLPDDRDRIASTLRQLATVARLIVTTGGTGITDRDVTPEATRSVCDRILDGFGERMRIEGFKESPFAPLSRGVSGTLGSCLILNVPGNPSAAVQSLDTVMHMVPHALALLAGDTHHPDASGSGSKGGLKGVASGAQSSEDGSPAEHPPAKHSAKSGF